MRAITRKWRPPLALVVLAVCASLLAVPLIAITALQIGTTSFVHETESSLIKQAAIYASAFSSAFETEARPGDGPIPGYYLPPDKRVFWSAEARTFQPLLYLLGGEIEPALPAAVPSVEIPDPRYERFAPQLQALEQRASHTTLSGVIFLDFRGLDLAANTPTSLAAVPEVQQALRGEIGVALRWHNQVDASRSWLSLLRGTGFQVLVAYPVISSNRVVGAVYVSRTPPRIESFFAEQSSAFIIVIALTLLGAAIMGTVLVRMVLRPILALRDQARLLAGGKQTELVPLPHYGMREIAELGEAVTVMAANLSQHTREIGIYTNHVTHELKSPITAIVGAAELLEDEGLSDSEKQKLAASIKGQGARMARLLDQLREVTRSRGQSPGKPGRLDDMIPQIAGLTISVTQREAILPVSTRHGEVILTHLAQNAGNHGADGLVLDWDGHRLRLTDNGHGFADIDLKRLGEPFFTTRRADGGTGLGLAIVTSILGLYGARLIPVASAEGAIFDIVFP